MFQVRIEAGFAAAHFITDYNGKCENLHGHNYKVFLYAQGDTLGKGGMLYDFTQLKKIAKEILVELDHSNLNDIEFFDNNPSAERIALYIFNHVKDADKSIPLYRVDVFETEKNRATYRIDL